MTFTATSNPKNILVQIPIIICNKNMPYIILLTGYDEIDAAQVAISTTREWLLEKDNMNHVNHSTLLFCIFSFLIFCMRIRLRFCFFNNELPHNKR